MSGVEIVAASPTDSSPQSNGIAMTLNKRVTSNRQSACGLKQDVIGLKEVYVDDSSQPEEVLTNGSDEVSFPVGRKQFEEIVNASEDVSRTENSNHMNGAANVVKVVATEEFIVEQSSDEDSVEVDRETIKEIINTSSDISVISDTDSIIADMNAMKIVQIEQLLEAPVLDMDSMRKLASTEDGFVTNTLRHRVWKRLLNITDSAQVTVLTREESKAYGSYVQVVMDVERTLKRFPPNITADHRTVLMEELICVIVTVLSNNPQFNYYQGYHDVALTLLLVCGPRDACLLLQELSLTLLETFLRPTMCATMHSLTFILPLVKRDCPELYRHIMRSEVGTVFCLPWLITWFSHSMSDHRDVLRLYDFLLCHPAAPLMAVYVAAAMVRHREASLLETDCDVASMHVALSQIADGIGSLPPILSAASLSFQRYPPEALVQEVDDIIAELKRAEAEARERRPIRRPLPATSGGWVSLVPWPGATLVVVVAVVAVLVARSVNWE